MIPRKSSEYWEALALCWRLQLIVLKNWSNISAESDKNLIDCVNGKSSPRWSHTNVYPLINVFASIFHSLIIGSWPYFIEKATRLQICCARRLRGTSAILCGWGHDYHRISWTLFPMRRTGAHTYQGWFSHHHLGCCLAFQSFIIEQSYFCTLSLSSRCHNNLNSILLPSIIHYNTRCCSHILVRIVMTPQYVYLQVYWTSRLNVLFNHFFDQWLSYLFTWDYSILIRSTWVVRLLFFSLWFYIC